MLKELLAKLLKAGFATATEKSIVKSLFKGLEKDTEKEEVKEDVETTEALPEEAPADGDNKEGKEEEALEEEAKKMVAGVISKEVEDLKKANKKDLDATKKALIEHKELGKQRAGIYSKETQETRKALNGNLRKFLTALIENDHAVCKDLSEGTDGKGGYLFQPELNAEIQHLVTEYGVARREMTTITLSNNQLNLNNLAADISTTWTDETVAKTSSDITIGQVNLVLKKLAVIVPMSDELLEDSEIDLVSFLTGRIAEDMSEKEDEAFFNGDGTGTFGSFTGILNNGSVNTVTMTGTTFASMDADDLLDMQDATPQGAIRNGKYYMHRSIRSLVRKLKASDGTYIYQAPAANAPATIWGMPVVEVEVMPTTTDTAAATAFIIFGDMKKAAWLGSKGGMRVAVSNEATVRNTAGEADINLFRQDMTALRVVERVGYVLVLPTALTVLKSAAASA